jgi:RHS repeat-associated protein
MSEPQTRTKYAYDTLNRLTSKTYSDSTHAVTYSYDGTTCIGVSPCYNEGHRTGMVDAAGSESWSYDKLGRDWGDRRITSGITKQTTYTYNLDGSLATLTYPSGRTITYTPNAAGRPISSIDIANSITYAINGSYTPHGALMTLSNGTQFNSTYIYNQRLQPCWMYTTAAPGSLAASSACNGSATVGTIMDLTYKFNAGSTDNGNVISITNNRDTTRSQAFGYDTLNRISSAQTTSNFSTSPANCWGEQFHYDQWANFLSISVSSSAYTGCSQQSLSILVNGSNQISSPAGYVYDADGNLTTVPAPGAASYAYNAENQMTSTAGVNYTYDGNGKRVEKSNGKLYWYGSRGEVLDETDLSGNVTSEYVFFGSTRIARRDAPSNNVFFYFGDHLGTSREIVQSGQTTSCYEADFYPFGGERTPIVNTCPQNYKFTGKERDSESTLDYFGARYYSNTMGRWASPDWSATPSPVPYVVLSDPQTLNLYAYVRNNPVTSPDSDGHMCFWECLRNYLKYQDWATDKEVQQMISAKRKWLVDNVVLVDGFRRKDFQKLSNDQVLTEYDRAQAGIESGRYTVVGTPVGPAGGGFAGLKSAEPVGSALKDDLYHQGATWMRDVAAEKGTAFSIIGADGNPATLIQMEGNFNGVVGRYDYIVDSSGELTHQMFVKGGKINGVPIIP